VPHRASTQWFVNRAQPAWGCRPTVGSRDNATAMPPGRNHGCCVDGLCVHVFFMVPSRQRHRHFPSFWYNGGINSFLSSFLREPVLPGTGSLFLQKPGDRNLGTWPVRKDRQETWTAWFALQGASLCPFTL
jgi:hypothetical protein